MMFLLGDARSQNRAGGSGRLRSARFHADMARRQSLEQRHYLAAPAFLSCSGVLQGQTPYPFLFRQDFQNRAPFALSDALGSQLFVPWALLGVFSRGTPRAATDASQVMFKRTGLYAVLAFRVGASVFPGA